MRHAREDYQERIIDTAELIPEDEPVFILRGQDKTAPLLVDLWGDLNAMLGGDEQLIRRTRLLADEMRKWQVIKKSKIADL